jgi:proton-translocating NADH-quinone oxidoreductase chain L
MIWLYTTAVLIPLVAFAVEAIFIRQLKRLNAYIATGAIAFSCLLSVVGFVAYAYESNGFHKPEHEAAAAENGSEHASSHGAESSSPHKPLIWSAHFDWVVLGGPAVPAQPGGSAKAPGGLVVPLGIAIDNLTVIMFLMVTFIATLIHIYSMGYMHDDPRYPRFFVYLSLFCFSMLGLVASANLFMIFIFWELVGVCSYLLIGFWYEEKSNCDAANKAFVVNRVGDVGMLVGLGLLWSSLGTFSFQDINQGLRDSSGKLNAVTTRRSADEVVQLIPDPATHEVARDPVTGEAREIPYWMLTLAGLGIFAGCVGKSAQFPLHVWLPDAMAGPTPVSALIHAATMVAAGVYLVGRFFPVFTGDVLLYIAYTGGATLFIAATTAMVQTDYKKVLAYSTVSQLGFMMLGLGVGGWAAGLFHLVTHAFFKALLFLGAGSVYHSVHTYEMPALGGLIKKMPRTGYSMLVGTLAISGVPFFAGFYSKDAILAAAIARVLVDPQHFLLFLLPALGAVLTAFYMFRMWFLTFAGEPRGFPSTAQAVHSHVHDEEHALVSGHGHESNPAAHAHESEPIMTWPLLILAFFSIFSGWTLALGLPFGTPLLEGMLEYGEPYRGIDAHATHYYALAASLLIMLSGIGLALLYYAPKGFPYFVPTRFSAAQTAERLGGVYNFLVHKWYFDELYWAVFVRPCMAIARFCFEIDKVLIDGLIDGAAATTALLARLEGVFDMIAVDRLVNLTGKAVYAAGDWSRSIQTGRLRNYLMFLAVALVGLFAGVFAWIRS